jgi:hypothetical protein
MRRMASAHNGPEQLGGPRQRGEIPRIERFQVSGLNLQSSSPVEQLCCLGVMGSGSPRDTDRTRSTLGMRADRG